MRVVGGRSAPIGVLGELGDELVVVHGQADQLRLRSAAAQRDALDRFAGAPAAAGARASTAPHSPRGGRMPRELERLRRGARCPRPRGRASCATPSTRSRPPLRSRGEDAELADRADRLVEPRGAAARRGAGAGARVRRRPRRRSARRGRARRQRTTPPRARRRPRCRARAHGRGAAERRFPARGCRDRARRLPGRPRRRRRARARDRAGAARAHHRPRPQARRHPRRRDRVPQNRRAPAGRARRRRRPHRGARVRSGGVSPPRSTASPPGSPSCARDAAARLAERGHAPSSRPSRCPTHASRSSVDAEHEPTAHRPRPGRDPAAAAPGRRAAAVSRGRVRR